MTYGVSFVKRGSTTEVDALWKTTHGLVVLSPVPDIEKLNRLGPLRSATSRGQYVCSI